MEQLSSIFCGISSPIQVDAEKPIYAVAQVTNYASYFIGKDSTSHACLLVSSADRAEAYQAPIRLHSLSVQFETKCIVRGEGTAEQEATFTVITCQSLDRETTDYFLYVCETILRIVGDRPSQHAIASAVYRLANIFGKTQRPPTRTVNGLFGELFFMYRSRNPKRAIQAWRVNDTARFDFTDSDIRIDVKTASGRLRVHTFNFEQCNPPGDTTALAASLFIERTARGISLKTLIERLEELISYDPEIVFKLHEIFTATLGNTLNEALATNFDEELAESSLHFYDLRAVPAIRGPLPALVSDVHFRSDLSDIEEVDLIALASDNVNIFEFLPLDRMP